jgi:DNA-binding NarL/FixJ family response regulator
MDAGAQGYILKENAVSDLLAGLKAAASGGVFISPSVAGYLMRRHQRASALKEERKGLARLTPTERRVLHLVAENKTNKEIGRELFISHRTVETHRHHICEKLGISGNRALLKFAFAHTSEL